MPTINELPEPSGEPAGPSMEDTPPPGTFADSGITPGGPAHIEFIGTLFGSPEPAWVTSPTLARNRCHLNLMCAAINLRRAIALAA